ncbi:NADH-quinone oxidoreductase subunit NuoG [Hyphomicrobium sp. NDB2Meth4]|uniref:NADH-quinone oxidoreductase subunit NuoG n=1 Tax=Hyphomicrobium sp. NDB2Meth4 TaxID=1892846 RepID=UPI00092FF204|nr:NADH-quinone oxidoreductase subunit NuoG [Hyphomicrobium sp. NDB2Meth4]
MTTKPIIIDGKQIEVEPGTTILQACEMAGVEIPRFCYHERLSIAGNCRMCLVEVEGIPKPIASCAMGVTDLPPNKDGAPRKVLTASPMVKAAREGVMEFLLINHPLDCPICDQGGECDLQDQAMAYGVGGSRYDENKRAVEEKYIGPLIKTFMNRCIHCTRCIRFMTEVAGVEELGAISRGEDMEITTYLDRGILSEMSANVNDLCPVGALTHRPWSYIARPWELDKTESIDVMDALGSAIRVDSRGKAVLRVLPRNNDDVNEEWISDKTRFACDGLRMQRLDQPYVREAGRLRPANWDEALALAAQKLKEASPERIGFLAGDLASVEEMFAFKDLASRLKVANIDCRQDGAKLDPALGRASYLFNSTIAGIDEADAILLIGTNPRLEAAVLNARILKRWRQGGLKVGVIGEAAPLTYKYDYLGAGGQTLQEVADGKHSFAEVLKDAKRPLIIVGAGAVARADGAAILGMASRIALGAIEGKDVGGWNPMNVLHTAASRVGGLDLQLVPGKGGLDTAGQIAAAAVGKLDVLYLLGVDEIDVPPGAFVIYQGHHGDRGAHRADVILPGAAYTEKSGSYVNTEGRVQLTERVVFAPGQAKEDWAILRALSAQVGNALPYDTLAQLRSEMYKDVPHFARLNEIAAGSLDGVKALAKATGSISAEPFVSSVKDFYLTNPIARSSAVMAEMSALKKNMQDSPRLKAAE